MVKNNIFTSIIFFLIIMLPLNNLAQSSSSDNKKYQVGIITALEFSFNDPQTVNLINEGAGVGFHGGISFKKFFLDHNNIGITTGLYFDAESFDLNYFPDAAENPIYYSYEDKDILEIEDNPPSNTDTVMLMTRNYKPIYLTVPLTFQLQTKQIGYFRYFGHFGLNTSVLLNTKVNDEIQNVNGDFEPDPTQAQETLEDMNTNKELQFIKSNIVFGAGINWFFLDKTSLHAEISYHFGFTNIMRGESRSLYDDTGNVFGEKVTQDKLMLRVGILF